MVNLILSKFVEFCSTRSFFFGGTMFKKVETPEELTLFNNIWMGCWLEKGYEFEFYTGPADRFLIQDPSSTFVGTIEFKTYSHHQENNINSVYPFHLIDLIKNSENQTIEIDKVAILKEYRGKNLDRLLTLFAHYSEINQIKYCVVLLERVFFKALKSVYKIPVDAVGEKFYYKGDFVVPAIIYAEKMYQEKEKYQWLKNMMPYLLETIR
jgi:hypothetical protein